MQTLTLTPATPPTLALILNLALRLSLGLSLSLMRHPTHALLSLGYSVGRGQSCFLKVLHIPTTLLNCLAIPHHIYTPTAGPAYPIYTHPPQALPIPNPDPKPKPKPNRRLFDVSPQALALYLSGVLRHPVEDSAIVTGSG